MKTSLHRPENTSLNSSEGIGMSNSTEMVERVAKEQRYDVCYHANHVTIDAHFCREWDEDGGCYGTNPDHGMSFEDACAEVAEWYSRQAELWRTGQHHEALWFISAALSPEDEGSQRK